MTGVLNVSKTADRTDPCARLTIGLLRLGTGRAALPGAAGRDGHRRPAAGAAAGTADTATTLAAPAYPAPPVVTVDAAPAPGAAAGTADTATTLASTGAGFNVGATLLITVTVLLGVGLVLLGRHLRRSNTD